jgi:hypothetical protein
MHSPMFKNEVPCVACVFKWESICEHSEREGKSLAALPVEGATQAPVMDKTTEEEIRLCCIHTKYKTCVP